MVRAFFIGLACCTLVACGTARTAVEDRSDQMARARTIQVIVPSRTHNAFAEDLAVELYEETGFAYGSGTTLRYRFVGFTEGSRARRFLFGGIGNVGETSIIIETEFVDQNGEVLARIQTEGRIDNGFMGGGMSSAIERAAEDIAEYARANVYSRQ
jgi:hypothetical protein